MITSQSYVTRLRHRLRLAALALPATCGLALLGGLSVEAKPVPSNLGNGLDKLVASKLAIAEAKASGVKLDGLVKVNGKNYVDEATAAVANSSLSDESGRVLVRVNLNSDAPFKTIKKSMKAAAATLSITAVDKQYKGAGVLNALVDVAEVPALASVKGVTSVILEWKPQTRKSLRSQALAPTEPGATVGEVITKVGTTFDQGVTQHRVDQISSFFNSAATLNLAGQGMQIACISNSFAANTASPASTDVANFDLPGASNNPINTTPTFVLQDDLGSTTSDDEGRGMIQIVHKMAPYAKLGFATADGGEVGFANNIRGLAGLSGYTVSGQTFAADVVCDDVGYYDEPYFQDGIIGNGIDDVAAAGVSYFSSAANDIGVNGYDSDTRWVANGSGLTAAAGNTALAGTNINLANVPTNLYAGGFHNFNPNGLDVAQTVNATSAANAVPTVLQWNDVYDQNTSVNVTNTLLSTSGTYTTAALTFTATGTVTAGTNYQVVETATGGSTFDGIVTVYKADGTTVIAGPQDTGTDETVRFVAPANDTGFVVKVDHFGATTGAFTLNVQSFQGFTTPGPTTSLSLLVFNLTTGAYISGSSLTADATATNEPIQLGVTARPTGATQVQYVIARTVVPAAGFNFPTHLRYLIPGNGLTGLGPAEYFTYTTVTTGGHAMANGCNGTAAYSVFRPSLPETFTSPGPVNIYYNKQDQRLATPEIRLQPRIAAADGANISSNESTAGLGSDSNTDPDTQGNFFGTSAAAPHAAAIATLVLQNKGGRRSVTPAQMTSILERSTFPHDLDPNYASGSARVSTGGKVTLSISSDGSANGGTGTNDNNAFVVSYIGSSSLTSLVFNPAGTAAAGGNTTGGNNGVTYPTASNTAVGGVVTYFENSLPGACFLPGTHAFALGSSTTATPTTGITGVGSNLSSGTVQFYTFTVTVPSGVLTGGKVLTFGVGRGVARSATTGSSFTTVTSATTGGTYPCADIFGGGVSLPNGQVGTGMTFNGTTADGGSFTGTIVNRIGSGYSPLDGYGFINAQAAVTASVQ